MLLSYVVKLLCLDKNKTGCVDIDLPLHVLVFLRHPKYPFAAESKFDNCVGCNYAFLRFLWPYVVELLCLDTNKTGCVDLDLPSVALVFFEAPQYPLAGESKSNNCVGYYHACLRFLWVFLVVVCG